ncbi:MAG TPA: antibiotic biosynthesis monooxygenase [Gammaproteobacteria bacterium]|nr:antibiotic biosynthesis monooxygenase [Gammaproteobacteria bacterium]
MANLIVINPFEVPQEKEQHALELYDKYAEYIRNQTGYVSARLHRSINPDARFTMVVTVEWACAEDYLAAMQSPEFRQMSENYKVEFLNNPELYEVVRS